MFTREELEQTYDDFAAEGALPLQVQEFSGDEDFSFDPEQHVDVIRGSKRVFRSTMQFWIHSFRFVLHRGRELQHQSTRDIMLHPANSICQPVSEQVMWAFVDNCLSTLRRPYRIELQGQFLAAMLMGDEWNDKQVLCETTDPLC